MGQSAQPADQSIHKLSSIIVVLHLSHEGRQSPNLCCNDRRMVRSLIIEVFMNAAEMVRDFEEEGFAFLWPTNRGVA